MSSTGVDLPKGAQARSKQGDATTSSTSSSSQDDGRADEQTQVLEKKEKQSPSKARPMPKKREEKFSYWNLLPLLIIGIAYLAIKLPASRQRVVFNWNTTENVFAFGDSWTYVQGKAGRPGFSFIGDALAPSFKPERLLSNEIVSKRTSSGGSNWIQFLTNCTGGRPSDCTPHKLWNFAFADAGIDSRILPAHSDFTLDVRGQVDQWVTYAKDIVPHPPASTLTVWWAGMTDAVDAAKNTTIDDWTAFWHSELRSYFNAVEFAYSKGLRGTYLFLTVPPLHLTPSSLLPSSSSSSSPSPSAETLKRRVQEFNNILWGFIEGFAVRHRDMTVLSFDAHEWFEGMLEEGGKAEGEGFKDVRGFCQCPDPAFFWYDDKHPSERVHVMLAKAVEALLLMHSA